jgi:hypothetical protein
MPAHGREVLRRFTSAQLRWAVAKFILGVTDVDGIIADVLADYSDKQTERIHQPVFIMARFYEQLILKYEIEQDIITQALADRSQLVVEELKLRRTVHLEQTCRPALADVVSRQAEGIVKPLLVLEWYRGFRASGCQGFAPDGRGAYEREAFLERCKLVTRFKQYMTFDMKLSVDRAIVWLDTVIRGDAELMGRAMVQNILPLSRSTVHTRG